MLIKVSGSPDSENTNEPIGNLAKAMDLDEKFHIYNPDSRDMDPKIKTLASWISGALI
jgi:hypothetical protein